MRETKIWTKFFVKFTFPRQVLSCKEFEYIPISTFSFKSDIFKNKMPGSETFVYSMGETNSPPYSTNVVSWAVQTTGTCPMIAGDVKEHSIHTGRWCEIDQKWIAKWEIHGKYGGGGRERNTGSVVLESEKFWISWKLRHCFHQEIFFFKNKILKTTVFLFDGLTKKKILRYHFLNAGADTVNPLQL